jgi:hypothetical protein
MQVFHPTWISVMGMADRRCKVSATCICLLLHPIIMTLNNTHPQSDTYALPYTFSNHSLTYLVSSRIESLNR